ncbi:MAG: hypothetical protein AAFQ98_20200 [Bacteroidota bacterium]
MRLLLINLFTMAVLGLLNSSCLAYRSTEKIVQEQIVDETKTQWLDLEHTVRRAPVCSQGNFRFQVSGDIQYSGINRLVIKDRYQKVSLPYYIWFEKPIIGLSVGGGSLLLGWLLPEPYSLISLGITGATAGLFLWEINQRGGPYPYVYKTSTGSEPFTKTESGYLNQQRIQLTIGEQSRNFYTDQDGWVSLDVGQRFDLKQYINREEESRVRYVISADGASSSGTIKLNRYADEVKCLTSTFLENHGTELEVASRAFGGDLKQELLDLVLDYIFEDGCASLQELGVVLGTITVDLLLGLPRKGFKMSKNLVDYLETGEFVLDVIRLGSCLL